MTNDAFTKAITEMVQTLYRISSSQLSIAADREDAVQETLRRAWEKRASLKNENHLQTWVIRILINTCHDIQRERRRMIPTEGISEPMTRTATDTMNLRDCLLQLDERERIPVMLHYIEGYEIRQIAAILHIPQGTVKSRLNRGRRQLKDLCREDVFES